MQTFCLRFKASLIREWSVQDFPNHFEWVWPFSIQKWALFTNWIFFRFNALSMILFLIAPLAEILCCSKSHYFHTFFLGCGRFVSINSIPNFPQYSCWDHWSGTSLIMRNLQDGGYKNLANLLMDFCCQDDLFINSQFVGANSNWCPKTWKGIFFTQYAPRSRFARLEDPFRISWHLGHPEMAKVKQVLKRK